MRERDRIIVRNARRRFVFYQKDTLPQFRLNLRERVATSAMWPFRSERGLQGAAPLFYLVTIAVPVPWVNTR